MDINLLLQVLKVAVGFSKWRAESKAKQEAQQDEEVAHLHGLIRDAMRSKHGASQSVQSHAPGEAHQVRGLLMADMYNPPLRRLYLSIRTAQEVELDGEEGSRRAGIELAIPLTLAGFALGGAVGFIGGLSTSPSTILGINIGTSFEISWSSVLLGSIIGAVLFATVVLRFAKTRVGVLWAELGPFPIKLQNRGADAIRRRLFLR